MELFSWITDLIEFLGISGLIVLFSATYLIRKRLTGRFNSSRNNGRISFNRTNGNYRNNYSRNHDGYQEGEYNYNQSHMNHGDYELPYAHAQETNENSQRNYEGVNGAGEFVMNGSFDEFDITNQNHYQALDSFDNNIDEDNPTKPW